MNTLDIAKDANPGNVSVLRVGFPPDENPQEIIRKNRPLLNYLKQRTGVEKVEISVPESYTSAIEGMRRRELDLVYFGGLTYVLAKNDLDITPLVRGQVDGTADNFTLIIARKDSGINGIEDLRGRSFAFGDVASTSGHLIPHQALLQIGIDPNKHFDRVVYTGAHDKTAMAVFDGKVEAGAMNARLYPIMVARGPLKEDELIVLWRSMPFADYPWAVHNGLGEKLIDDLRQAFVELTDPDMLGLLGVDGYQKTTDTDFVNIREAARKLGFMKNNPS